MRETHFQISGLPAVLYGPSGRRVYLFVHGQNGCKEDAALFAAAAGRKGVQTLSVDLPGHGERTDETGRFFPWYIVPELRMVMQFVKTHWPSAALCANSIGAWLSMLSFAEETLTNALFISPVLDMCRLIDDMMRWADVTRAQLQREKEIETDFGQTLSWEYLHYAAAHPIVKWDCPTEILYAGQDHLTEYSTVQAFARKFGSGVTIADDAPHWFHTPEQLSILCSWIERVLEKTEIEY